VAVLNRRSRALSACGSYEPRSEAIDSTIEDFIAAGPREVLVHEADLEAARALLPEP
jgi:hypothetical protein